MSNTRKIVYGFLSVAIIFGITAKCLFLHRISQYQRGKERLEISIQKDERFHNVRIFCYPTKPSTFLLAPIALPLNARRDLEHLVSNAFGSLPVKVRYAGAEFFGSASGASNSESNQFQNGPVGKAP